MLWEVLGWGGPWLGETEKGPLLTTPYRPLLAGSGSAPGASPLLSS